MRRENDGIDKNCDYTAKLSDYLDSELNEIESRVMEEHLEACQNCSDTASDIRKQKALLAHLKTATISEKRYDDLWDKIEAATVSKGHGLVPLNRLIPIFSYGLLLLFGTLAGVIGSIWYNSAFMAGNYQNPAMSGEPNMIFNGLSGRTIPVSEQQNYNKNPFANQGYRQYYLSKDSNKTPLIFVNPESHKALQNNYRTLLEKLNNIKAENSKLNHANSRLEEQVKILIQSLEKSGVKLRAIRAVEKIEEDNETIEGGEDDENK